MSDAGGSGPQRQADDRHEPAEEPEPPLGRSGVVRNRLVSRRRGGHAEAVASLEGVAVVCRSRGPAHRVDAEGNRPQLLLHGAGVAGHSLGLAQPHLVPGAIDDLDPAQADVERLAEPQHDRPGGPRQADPGGGIRSHELGVSQGGGGRGERPEQAEAGRDQEPPPMRRLTWAFGAAAGEKAAHSS